MPKHLPVGTATQLVAQLRELLPARRPLGLNEPAFGTQELQNLGACLASGWVSGSGAFVDRFEQQLTEITGIPHAIATVNGTAAIHLCLIVAGVQVDDEVLLPSLTFVGSVNPVCHLGAVPHFVDVERETLGVDPERLAQYLQTNTHQRDGLCVNQHSGRVIRALVCVHCLGHPCQVDRLAEICTRHGIQLIEDAAESLGAYRDGQHTGHWGLLSALSFNGNKIVTTGGGGAVLTTDGELARSVRHLATTAKQPHAWEFVHDRAGLNYRLPNLNAALGCAQLDDLSCRLDARRRDALRLADAFASMRGVSWFPEPPRCRSNHWLHLILLADRHERDSLLQLAQEEGMQLRPLWRPLHLQPYLTNSPAMECPVAVEFYQRGVCLPAVLADSADDE